jgi:mono/diheme cytochrome c family protein
MKTIIHLTVIALLLSLQSASADTGLCSDPLKGELCYNMVYLRSQMLALGEQRELMQVNYPYLSSIGKEIRDITEYLFRSSLVGTIHAEGLQSIKTRSLTLVELANAEDPLAMAAANGIQKTCANCHTRNGSSSSGLSWEQIFKNDWDNIVKNCSREGRTPYMCRSMNGMMTAYAGIFAQNQLGRKSVEALKQSAMEISRIATDLRNKRLLHDSTAIYEEVVAKADEVAQLADGDLEGAFAKGLLITQACMGCHGNLNVNRPWMVSGIIKTPFRE